MSVLFAILALVCAIIGTFAVGYFAVIGVIILTVLAVVFAMKKRKEVGSGGIGSIVLSVAAVLISLLIYALLAFFGSTMKEDSAAAGVPQLAKYGDSLKKGFIGMATEMSKDDVDTDKLKEDFDKLLEYMNSKNGNDTKTENNDNAENTDKKE